MADDIFKALADPTRRTILDELAEKSGQTLFEICSRLSMKHQLGISRQAISQHLAVRRPEGRGRPPFVPLGRSDGREDIGANVEEILAREWPRWLDPGHS